MNDRQVSATRFPLLDPDDVNAINRMRKIERLDRHLIRVSILAVDN